MKTEPAPIVIGQLLLLALFVVAWAIVFHVVSEWRLGN